MNILHVIPSLGLDRGGPTSVVGALSACQFRAGHDVTIACTDQGTRNGEPVLVPLPGVEVVRTSVVGPDRLAWSPGFAAALRRPLAVADIVHIHSIFTWPVHAAMRGALRMRVPVVLRPCGLLHEYSMARSALQKRLYLRIWGGTVLRAVTAWHHTSRAEADGSRAAEGDVEGFVLPNGIDVDTFRSATDWAGGAGCGNRPPGCPAIPADLRGRPYVAYLGRLHPKKRPDLLIKAFLRGAPRSHVLLLAGNDEAGIGPELDALVPADRRPDVRRIGPLFGEAKTAFLAGAAVFCLPSEHENFGVAALEAAACGAWLLLSPHVDLAADAADAGVGEILPLDEAAWAGRLSRLPEPWVPDPRAATRSARWAAGRYSWDRIAARLDDEYRRAIHRHAARFGARGGRRSIDAVATA